MEVATFHSKQSHSSVQYNDRPNNWFSTLVSHYASHTFMDLEGAETKRNAWLYDSSLKYKLCITVAITCKINKCQCRCSCLIKSCIIPLPTCLAETSCSQSRVWPAAQREETDSSQCTL